MSYGLYISAEGARAQDRRVEALANNMANVDTVGFKRDLALFQARYAEETRARAGLSRLADAERPGGRFWLSDLKTDFSPGTLKRTGNPTDMAVRGDGFFMVRRPDGDFLTRAGNFMFNSYGRLVTQDNYPVLDDAGQPIDIDPDQGPWQLAPGGLIVQDGSGQQIGDGAAPIARRSGQGRREPVLPRPPTASRSTTTIAAWMAGFSKQSDVKPTSEMIELIEASRAFEANLSMIQNHDQMLGTLDLPHTEIELDASREA